MLFDRMIPWLDASKGPGGRRIKPQDAWGTGARAQRPELHVPAASKGNTRT